MTDLPFPPRRCWANFPQAEIDRLDLQHHIFRLTFNDQICLCPKKNGAKRVLDLGTGTGIWCIEYGTHTPSKLC
jgi:hypothetical protein